MVLLVLMVLFWCGLKGGNDLMLFMVVLGVFVVSFVGIGISFFFMMVLLSLMIW